MAYISRLSDYVRGGVAQDSIPEGSLVTISTSGVRALSELPNVQLAASGTVYPVFVAMVPPDNFPRPTNSLNYTATYEATIRADLNTGWGNPVDSYTLYRQGLSTLENPTLTSGMLTQLHRGTTVSVPSGLFVDEAGIKVNGALVKPADDGTGKYQLTAIQAEAVGYVEEFDPNRYYLTVTIKQ